MVAEIGVADALDETANTAAELAAATGVNPTALGRVLRLPASYGVFELRNDHFVHTAASRLLRSDHPQSMRSYVRMIGLPLYWETLGKMMYTLKTGASTTEQITPGGSWAYLAQNPEASKLFDEAMTGKAHGQIAGMPSSNMDSCARLKHVAPLSALGHTKRPTLQPFRKKA